MGLEKILRPLTRIALASTILYSGLSCSGGSSDAPRTPTGPLNPPVQTPTTPTTPQTPQPTGPKLFPNTVVLDQTTLNSISSYSNGTLNFSSSPGQVNSLSVGKIIAGGISQATPYGFLRKVTSISSDKRTIGTQQATLAEAIEQGSISFRRRLTPSGLSSYLRNESAFSSTANQVGFDFGTTFDKIFDADDNLLTTNDQFRVKGRTNFNYELNFNLDIGAPFRLDKFLLENTVTQESEINVSGKIPVTYFSKDLTVLEFPLPPQMYTLPTVPPFPFVVTPTLRIKVGIDGKVYPQMTANLIHQSSFNAGIKYENGGWTKFSTPTNNFNFSPPPTLVPSNTYSEIKAHVGPQLELLIDKVVGPNIGVEGYMKLNSDYVGNSYLELWAGLKVPVGIRAEIFGFSLLDRQETIFDFSKLLGQWSISTQLPPQTPTNPSPVKTDTLYSIKDAYVRWSNLSSTTANTNFNSDILKLKRDEGRSYEETLIQFLMEALPTNITINSANLSLYGFCAGNVSGSTNFSVVKNLQNWVENGVTWNSKPSQSNSSYGGLSVPRDGSKRRDVNITSLVKEWSANRPQNYGLAMVVAEDLADCTFNSKEHLDSTTRPRLIISYTQP